MTIRYHPALLCLPAIYSVVCVRCGESIADFYDPQNVQDAIEANGGRLVVDQRCIDDCVAACVDCKDNCNCPNCGALLENDTCPDCPLDDE
jgi:hypothetical protein